MSDAVQDYHDSQIAAEIEQLRAENARLKGEVEAAVNSHQKLNADLDAAEQILIDEAGVDGDTLAGCAKALLNREQGLLYRLELDKAERDAAVASEAVLREALERIERYRVEPFEHPPEEWAKHTPETCTECKRWSEMKHPLQNRCDGWYRLLHSRDDINDRANGEYEMRKIARATLATEPPAALEKLKADAGRARDAEGKK